MKRIINFSNTTVLVLLALCLITKIAHAVNADLHLPTTGATGGYQVPTSDTLDPFETSLGFEFNYAHDWYEGKIFAPSPPGVIAVGRELASTNFLVSLGIWEGLNFDVDIPFHIWHDVNVPSGHDQWNGSTGDVYFDLKARLINAHKNDLGIGLAAIPFLAVSTGQYYWVLGENGPTGGAKFAIDKIWKYTRLYGDVGGRFRQSQRISFLDHVHHEFIYGVGIQQTIVPDWKLDFITEVTGATNFQNAIGSPAELDALFRKTWLTEHFNIGTHVGAGWGLSAGYGAPDWRIFSGLSVTFNPKKMLEDRPKPPPPGPPKGLAEEPPENFKIELKGKINFEFDKSRILPESYPVLDEAVQIFKSHPELELVEIEGHTDSVGTPEYNMALSHRRANAVRQYFIQKGIAADRLISKGYGLTKPIDTNETEEGRAKNRRIVFTVKRYKKPSER